MEHLVLPLRVLVAAPRTIGPGPMPSRSKVEALYDALEAQGDHVEIEWLWPPTAEALSTRLDAPNSPAVNIICLDAVLGKKEGNPGLVFESDEPGGHVLSPDALAALLIDHDVRVLILNLTQPQDVEESVAKAFAADLAAGSGAHIVALNERLSKEGVGQAATALFSSLLAGQSPSQALSTASAALSSQGAAQLFLAGEDAPLVETTPDASSGVSKVLQFPSPDLLPAWQRLAVEPQPGGLPAEPLHGFVGRASELATLERILREESTENPLWVYGHEGLGKTSLLAHAARWLVRTDRFEQVAYVSFEGGGMPESALYHLGARLVGESFTLQEGDPVVAIENALAKTPALIIWDNVERILPEGEFSLGTEPLNELFQLAARFARAGDSRLCILSDTPTLPSQAHSAGSLSLEMALSGLNKPDTLDLLSGLLINIDAELPPLEQASEQISQLIEALGGHPLALCVIAAFMQEQPLTDIMAGLEEILPGLYRGEARQRNQALEVVLEYLIRSFDEALRPRLYSVGLFVTGFMQALGPKIVGLDEETWATFSERLASAQLLHTEPMAGLTVPFIHFHPGLARRLDRRLVMQQRASLEETYCNSYLGLLHWLSQTREKAPDVVDLLGRRELPNLRRALHLLLAKQNLSMGLSYTRHLTGLLEKLGFFGERDMAASRTQKVIGEAVPPKGSLSRAGVQLLLGQIESLFASGQLPQAGILLQQLCERMGREDGLAYSGSEATLDRGIAFQRLGRFLRRSGRPDAALVPLTQALNLLNGLEANDEVRRELVSLYEDMGEALLLTAQLEKAEEAAQNGLKLASELQDERGLGTMSAQLGTIAAARGNVDLAREQLKTALQHLYTTDETIKVITVWMQLGALALQTSDWPEAERCYDKAIELIKWVKHPLLQAQALVQLAHAVDQGGRPQDAEAKYTEAIGIYQEHDAQPAFGSTEMALAQLLLREGRLQDARIHAEVARVIASDLPNAPLWQSLVLLRRIAEAEGDKEREVLWRAQAQEAFAGSPDAESVRQRWQSTIQAVANTCRGAALDAETVELVENLETSEEWQQLAQAIWRILGGERGPELYAELDHIDALVVRSIIEAINAPETNEEDEQEPS